ncbi:copper binding periplasmic CusF family protein [Acidovorax sp. RAC01]|nr:copper binding periplasmic CusF family protein [Acidovorax sp. RAC01]
MRAARSVKALVWVLCAVLGASTAAVAVAHAEAPVQAKPVYTRARVVSVFQEPGTDGKLYVRLKLVPNAKIPYATHAFRVVDRTLLEGIPQGAWVQFTFRRVDGENTLTTIALAEACRRFEPCH